VLVGAVGWRLDHTLHNCYLLERLQDRLRVCLASHMADGVRIGPGETVAWSLRPGVRFSLLPLVGACRGVTIEGARYPLLGGIVGHRGVAAISNEVAYDPLLISVSEGSLLVLVDREGSAAAYED
jgi:thiamine pyrophosphokinase